MQFNISSSDGIPIYIQIVNQVKQLVGSGRLSPGEELPPIRALAEELVVNPHTISRAYLELEREGIVIRRHGSGTYISDGAALLSRREKLKLLTPRADSLLVEASHLQVDLEAVIALLYDRHETLNPESKK